MLFISICLSKMLKQVYASVKNFKIKYRRQGLYFISRIIFLLIVKKKIERGNNSKFIIKHYFQWTSYKKKKKELWNLNSLYWPIAKSAQLTKHLLHSDHSVRTQSQGQRTSHFCSVYQIMKKKTHHILLWTIEYNTCIRQFKFVAANFHWLSVLVHGHDLYSLNE